MKLALHFFIAILPWKLKRFCLSKFFGYDLHATAYIGKSLVIARTVKLGPNARIGNLTVIKGMDSVELGERARLGDMNWIYGFPSNHPKHFKHQPERRSILFIDHDSAVTKRHIIDCTNEVRIGKFSTFAGFRSQILTHSVDIEANRQSSAPITIGDYCFVGTDSVMLGGSVLPDYSVLGAKSLLNKAWEQTHTLYAGVSAKPVKELDPEFGYFKRSIGFVD